MGRQDYREVLDDDIAVDRNEIPGLLIDEGFILAVNEWHDYKQYGKPYSGGIKEQPCQWYDVIKMFDGLYAKHGGK